MVYPFNPLMPDNEEFKQEYNNRHGSFSVDVDQLKNAQQGLQQVLDELESMLVLDAKAKDGKGLGQYLFKNYEAVGHEGLAKAVATFGSKWQWGVRGLVDEAVGVVDALEDTRMTYERAEQQALEGLDQLRHITFGDPSKSYEESQNTPRASYTGEWMFNEDRHEQYREQIDRAAAPWKEASWKYTIGGPRPEQPNSGE